MSTRWQDIGQNSGNMKSHRNVKMNKLDYENGKWDSIYDISGNDKKGYTFDICGENIVVGIGTPKPFSRLSLGAVENSGVFNSTDPGQLAAIAVNETSNGGNFKGIIYNSNMTAWDNTTNDGLKLLASKKNTFDINDASAGKIIIGADNVVTIGGEPSMGNNDTGLTPDSGLDINDNNSEGQTKIVLDVKGSLRTNGYINFFNYNNNNPIPNGSFWNNNITRWDNIPRGSLWLKCFGGNNSKEGLYYKKQDGTIKYISPDGGSGGGASGSDVFDASFGSVPPFIIQKAPSSLQSTKSGGVNIKFDGLATTDTPTNGANFNNLLTLTRGNLAVCGISGELQAWPTPNGPLTQGTFVGDAKAGLPEDIDVSGGLIWVQRQLAIGPNKYNKNWSVIDMQTVQNAAAIMSYNIYDPNEQANQQFQPIKATNSLILLEKKTTDDGKTPEKSAVGNIYDCSNSIIIGKSFKAINTPNSLISNYEGQEILDPNGHNIVFGNDNTLKYSPYTIMFGYNNSIDNSNNSTANTLDSNGGGTIILGDNNQIDNSGIAIANNNIISGSNNWIGTGAQNIISGNLNESFGSNNTILGKSNKNGIDLTSFDNKIGKDYKTQYTFINGESNVIKVPYGKTTNGVFIAGNNNTLDLSGETFTSGSRGFVLLGEHALIHGENTAAPHQTPSLDIIEDLSNIKFAIGTKEKYDIRNATEQSQYGGNVFTVDSSGNTRIYGNLIVDGSNVIFRTEYVDVSDNNLTLNYPGTNSMEGGGFTIMNSNPSNSKEFSWTANGPHGSTDCWDTHKTDLSSNKIYGTNVITQDISALKLIVDDISGQNATFTGDISCNGKLTVYGVIDPIGMIISKSDGSALNTMENAGGIFTDGDELLFIPDGKDKDDAKTLLTIAGSGGSVTGMTKWTIAGDFGSERDLLQEWTLDISGGLGIKTTVSADPDTPADPSKNVLNIEINTDEFWGNTDLLATNGGLGTTGGKLQVRLGDAATNGTLPATKGGTGLDSYAVGDILYCNSADSLSKLTVGTTGQFIGVSSGKPAWDTPPNDNTEYTAGTNMSLTAGNAFDLSISSSIAMGSNSITGLAAPSNDNDAATKKYVDDLNSGGSGSSANAEQSKRVRIGKDDGATERHILFSISPSASPAYQDISGSANLKCTPSTGTFTATTFSGALSGNITSDTTSLGGDAAFSFTRPQHSTDDGKNTSITGQQGAANKDGGNLTLAGGDKGGGGSSADGSVVINSNWTAAGKTCADLGTVTTVDIDGGTIDGTTIGAGVKAAGTFTKVTIDPNAAAGQGLIISNTATQNANELVKITGEAGQTALNIDAGTSQFAEQVTMSDGLSLNHASLNQITLTDNQSTSLQIGSTDALGLLTLDTTNSQETVIVNGTTAQTAFHVDVGTSQFDEAVTMSAGLSLNQGTSNVITIDDNKASSLVIKSSGTNANFFTIDTTTDAEKVKLIGAAVGTDVFHVDVGTSQFDEGVTMSDGLSLNHASLNQITLTDNQPTSLQIGSTDALGLLTLDTTNSQETVIVKGTTAQTAFHVDVGTSQFDEQVTLGSTTGATVSAAGIVNVNNATEATSTTDGSLQTDGGLSVVKNAVIGQKLTAVGNFFYYTAPVTTGAAVDSTVANHTIGDTGYEDELAAFVSGLYIKTGSMGAGGDGSYTLPTATQIIGTIPGCVVGSSFRVTVKNNMTGTGAFTSAAAGEIQLLTTTGLSLYAKNKAVATGTTEFLLAGDANSNGEGRTYEFQVIVTNTSTAAVDIVQLW